MSLISNELLTYGSSNSEVVKTLVANLGSGENKIKLRNLEIVEHHQAKGVEL